MSLRTKLITTIILGLIILTIAVYVTSRVTLINSLLDIEQTESQRYIDRVAAALSHEVSELENTTVDWSSWDDTYEFINDGNSEYIKSNLIDDTFSTLRINLMVFVDSSGQIVFGKGFDLDNEEELPIPSAFLKNPSDSQFIASWIGSTNSGLILLDENPMIIVAQPILQSNDEGPARGTLIVGRYLDDAEVGRLENLTLSEISLYRVDRLSQELRAILPALTKNPESYEQVLSEQEVAAYRLVRDINGVPAIILQVTVAREIYATGQNAVIFNILIMFGIGLLLSGLTLWLINKNVLSRVAVIIKGLRNIWSSGDITTRIDVGGKDELTLVAGTVNGMLGALQESESELRKAFEDERELRENLEREISRRVEFTRALVHELKTPMTPILAATDLLLEEIKDSDLHSLARSIDRSASSLNKRIDELLDLAKSEVGQIQLVLGDVDSSQLLLEITKEAQSAAIAKGQSLTGEFPENLPVIQADKERLRQVIQNLLNNSVKYTPENGKIVISAREEENNLIIEVEDNGRGISKNDLDHIFDPYQRHETDMERLSGLGLGLAISKQLVELHGGQIWAQSKKGKGSTFGFSIPVKHKPPANKTEST